ncbi:MAG: hypothetical protein GXO90_01695 [FCB group bacterium]|nr:hypothetical protein [FCB group bacterium]
MMKRTIFLIMVTALWVIGCDTATTTNQDAIESELMKLIQDDETLQLDGLDDNGVTDPDYESGLDTDGLARILGDTLWPNTDQYRLRFGRRITNRTLNVDFDIQESEGLAYAHVTRTIQGIFRVIAIDSNETIVDSLEKPFESTFQRHIRFVQRDINSDSVDYGQGHGRHWRVDAMTIGDGITGTKVALQEIRVYTLNADTAVLTITADDIGTTYYGRDELPSFVPGQIIRMEADVANLGPEFPLRSGERVFYHYGRDRFHKGRKALIDEDDAGNYDNTFVAFLRIPRPGPGMNHQVFRGFFDVIDMGSLFAEDEAVHNEIWTVPFRSHRRGH